MAKCNDLTGQKFGRLLVIGKDNTRMGGYWICKCDCGNEKVIRSDALVKGITRSCGCLQSELQTENLVGQKFSRLTVIKRVEKPAERKTDHHAYWLCKCDCGEECIVRSSNLKSGNVKSCGCMSIEKSTKHGMRNDSIYANWCTIKQRCGNPNNAKYPRYGGRGISIYKEWENDFKAFYDYVSQLPNYKKEGYSINRIDNNGNYEPGNIEWANDKTQSNNKSNNHLLTYNGETHSIAQWAEIKGMNPYTLYNRILTYHWDAEKALTTPVKKTKNQINKAP
jgi:hypothetical protein